ncbi:MAG: hypothetical protein DRQ49_01645 [Gammaproteobacteria bacterium]|nr:MAG: hypothetical protein DRQ41_10280 [Gammaproteobacteria bacterium]RKZ42539.1 MAG: hypothetical protein DRQ49_01645 [Gammaproteobacteria bacterium]
MKLRHLLTIPILISSLGINAEVTLDGTLGHSGALPGPDYLIGADLGQQHGANLFHSFKDFNLQSFESATFSGPDSVSNVISRVTGGNSSQIDGLIRSTIPNADMYFQNPYGIMFGPNAQLDVQGSFHASTADYLRLGDGGHFDARNPSNSLLTVAPIEAFGFLTDTPASITTQDSDLSVSEGNSLSLIGGDLSLNGNSPVLFNIQGVMETFSRSILYDTQGFMAVFSRSKLSAPSGRINLVSVASQGEVIPSEFGLDLNAEGGTITANNTLIDVSSRGSGDVFIRGGQLIMDETVIQANTLTDQNGRAIDIKLTDSVELKGNIVSIMSNTIGSGNAGTITINVPSLTMTENYLDARSYGIGNAGDIIIKAKQISLEQGSLIINTTFIGQAGTININATDSISISGIDAKGLPTTIINDTHGGKLGSIIITTEILNIDGAIVTANNHGMFEGNSITLNADKINITDGGLVVTTVFSDGNGGDVNINANTISIIGRRAGFFVEGNTGLLIENNQSAISSVSYGKGTAGNTSIVANNLILDGRGGITAGTGNKGAAGNINVTVKKLFLGAGSEINSSSGGFFGKKLFIGQGPGGNIHVIATDNITISGQDDHGLPSAISTNSLGIGQGGDVKVETNHLNINDGSAITANAMGTGNAGNVVIQANTINLSGNGTITTSSEHATGGNITITVPNRLFLQEGQITTSVHGGTGDGGNITIENPVFVVLNQGKIKAQADAGHGGNIRIVADHFIKSFDSLISASSRLGIDGDVEIDSPSENVTEGLLTLPVTPIDTGTSSKDPCSVYSWEEYINRSRFDIHPIAGSPPSPYDLTPSRLSNAKKTVRQSSVMPEEQLF